VSCEGHVTDVCSNEQCHIVPAQKQRAMKVQGGRESKQQAIYSWLHSNRVLMVVTAACVKCQMVGTLQRMQKDVLNFG